MRRDTARCLHLRRRESESPGRPTDAYHGARSGLPVSRGEMELTDQPAPASQRFAKRAPAGSDAPIWACRLTSGG